MHKLARDERGVTAVETAFALPIFIMLVWSIFQLGLVFRASSGIQHALGEGARAATLWPTPDKATVEAKMNAAVFGIGPGVFTMNVPATPTSLDGGKYLDLKVTYTQATTLIFLAGPNITITRSKRVWVADDS